MAGSGKVGFVSDSFHGEAPSLVTRAYNGFNQMVSAYSDGVRIAYSYRPDGLRHQKSVTGRGGEVSTRVHLWDGQQIVAEVGSTGAIVARYPRGANLIAREQDGALQYYLHNAHGDVTERTDNLGTVLRRYKYDAFGNEQNPEPLDSNPFRFCGEYFDAELGEIYLRARYYDPRTGRFGAEDSARDGLNWYTYCNGNPVLYVDYSGASVLLAVLAVLGLAGILSGCEARSLPSASSSSGASSGAAPDSGKSSSIPAFINPLGPPDLSAPAPVNKTFTLPTISEDRPEWIFTLPAEWDSLIQDLSVELDIDPYLVYAIIAHESGGDPIQEHPITHATGLMQILASNHSAYLEGGQYYDRYEGARNIAEKAGANLRNLKDPLGNIAIGMMVYAEWRNLKGSDDPYTVMTGYAGLRNIPSIWAIFYYRDTMAAKQGKPRWHSNDFYKDKPMQ